MNEIKIFENSQFGQIRTITKDGEPWFVAADVCRALELDKTWNALQRLDDDEKGTTSISTLGGEQEVSIVNEPGLYALVLGSRKPEAKAFKRWITHDVIPAIRKTGGYIAGEESMSDEELLSRALLMAQEKIRQRDERILQLSVDNSRLTVENQIAAPKADYFDQLVDRNLLTNFRETAKELKIKERQFVGFLLEKKYIYRDKKGKLMPYAERNDGLFELKESINDKSNWSGTQTLITPKGRETFRLLTQGL